MIKWDEISGMIEEEMQQKDDCSPSSYDLHLHTYYSDGVLSPAALVSRAAARKVRTIAVTDHDGLGGIEEAIKAGKKEGIRVIPGIEFSAALEWDPRSGTKGTNAKEAFVHILGYGMDCQNAALKNAVQKIRELRQIRNEKLLEALNAMGYSLTSEDLYQHEGQDYVGKPNFAMALKNRGYVKTLKEAFEEDCCLRHPEVRKVHREKIEAEHAISLIRQAGGTAVLAHPYKIGALNSKEDGYFERLEAVLDELQAWGLAGIECRYSSHTKEQAQALIAIAKKRSLIITGGSDFHGPDYDKALDIGITISC